MLGCAIVSFCNPLRLVFSAKGFWRWLALASMALLVGCSSPPLHPDGQDSPVWRGRMAIIHPGPPPKQDGLGFVLGGSAQKGWLTIQSPMGQALAELTWSDSDMNLRDGTSSKRLDDVQAWSQQRLGVALNPQILFTVLQDPNAQITNWHIERRGPHQLLITQNVPPMVQIRIIVDERPAWP